MTRYNNIKPCDAEQFLIDHGGVFSNRKSTHVTYVITDKDGKRQIVQIITNNKTIHWKNVDRMIKNSTIAEEEWYKKFIDKHGKKKKK